MRSGSSSPKVDGPKHTRDVRYHPCSASPSLRAASFGSPDRDHNRVAETLLLLELIELAGTDVEHRLINDAIATVDRLGFVADHRHRGRSGHAGALEVADGRSPEIVWDAFDTRGLARRTPYFIVGAYFTPSARQNTHGITIRLRRSICDTNFRCRSRTWRIHVVNWNSRPAVSSFASPGSSPQPTLASEFDMAPLSCEQLRPNSPSGDVRELEQRAVSVGRRFRISGTDPLEETLPDVVLGQQSRCTASSRPCPGGARGGTSVSAPPARGSASPARRHPSAEALVRARQGGRRDVDRLRAGEDVRRALGSRVFPDAEALSRDCSGSR